MTSYNLLIIFGTRPEAIKMAPVVKAFSNSENFNLKICVTGQHKEMLAQVLDNFEIVPDFNLSIMQSNQDLTDITTRILVGLREIFKSFKPDMVLVHGDTTTAFAGALTSFYNKIPVAHVEAGLRTGDLYSPWPEEGNRLLISSLATINFAPTSISKDNLVLENVPIEKIYITGNTVIDALLIAKRKIDENSDLKNKILSNFPFSKNGNKMILVTAHRRENHGSGLEKICTALKIVATRHSDVEIVFPVHPNPAVKSIVIARLSNFKNIHLLDPLDYFPFVYLMSRSSIIVTDSGGIQEEAPSLGIPVLVMRETTERPEALNAGTVKLVGTDPTIISSSITSLLTNPNEYLAMSNAINPYGDGLASSRIKEKIFLFLNT